MTKSKLKTPFDRANSTHHKEINILHKRIADFQNLALERKKVITTFSNFVQKLVNEGRVSKDEVKAVFLKKIKK